MPSPPSTVARWAEDSATKVPLEEPHSSWKRFQILQNTIDFVIKVGLWLRLVLIMKLSISAMETSTPFLPEQKCIGWFLN